MCLQSIPLCVCSAVPDRKLVIGRERMRRTRPSLPWSPLFVGGQRACGVVCGREGIADSMRKWRSWEGGGWLGGGGGGSHALLVGTQLLLQPAPASTKFPFLERDSSIVTSINQSQARFWIYISFLLSVRTEKGCFGEKIVLNRLLVRWGLQLLELHWRAGEKILGANISPTSKCTVLRTALLSWFEPNQKYLWFVIKSMYLQLAQEYAGCYSCMANCQIWLGDSRCNLV